MQNEGLQLRFSSNSTGYEGVEFHAGRHLPFRAAYAGAELGCFVTAMEAAMCFARHMQQLERKGLQEREEAQFASRFELLDVVEPSGCYAVEVTGGAHAEQDETEVAPLSPRGASGLGETSPTETELCEMDGEEFLDYEALDCAVSGCDVAESDLFVSARSSTGYLGVYQHAKARNRPYYVQVVNPVTRKVQTGASFATAREAAVYYAEYRRMAGMFALHDHEELADEDSPGIVPEDSPGMVGGIRLHLSDRSATGYRAVYRERYKGKKKSSDKPFFVQVNKPYVFRLGNYHTAVEAAIAFAKYELLRQSDSQITDDIAGDISVEPLQPSSPGIFTDDEFPEAPQQIGAADGLRNAGRKRAGDIAWAAAYGGWEALLNGH